MIKIKVTIDGDVKTGKSVLASALKQKLSPYFSSVVIIDEREGLQDSSERERTDEQILTVLGDKDLEIIVNN